MEVKYWFPIEISHHDVSADIRTQVKTAIDEEFKKDLLTFLPNESLATSFYNQRNILDNNKLYPLREEILNVANSFANRLGYSGYKNLIIEDSWLNLFQKGNYEMPHNHYGSFISGVYYVSSNERCSKFYFEDHIETRKMWYEYHKQFQTNDTQAIKYSPVEGRMLLFPSWLIHGVLPNEAETERVSLAFNLVIEN